MSMRGRNSLSHAASPAMLWAGAALRTLLDSTGFGYGQVLRWLGRLVRARVFGWLHGPLSRVGPCATIFPNRLRLRNPAADSFWVGVAEFSRVEARTRAAESSPSGANHPESSHKYVSHGLQTALRILGHFALVVQAAFFSSNVRGLAGSPHPFSSKCKNGELPLCCSLQE